MPYLATSKLCSTLGYQFQDAGILDEALTHRSSSPRNNERLEFLGDALLNLIIADHLFQQYPKASEGELSRLRSTLVKGETLADLARGLQLGKFLYMGPGEVKSGGCQRTSVLSDALEALIGAVYRDSGFERCRELVLRLYQEALVNLPSADDLKDPKTRLQECLQARQQPLPIYHILATHGEPHAQSFTVECVAAALRTVATGASRRKAEQEAARLLLEQLNA